MEKYVNYATILPELIVSAVGVLVMLYDANTGGKNRRTMAWISIAGLAAAGAAIGWLAYRIVTDPAGLEQSSFSGMLTTDPMRLAFATIAIVVSILTVMVSIHWLDTDDLPAGEFYALLLFATVGMMLMAGAGDLVMIFLGLELLSIATYVMAGFRRRDLRSNESGLKYYILGSFATAFLLYGMALTYGATRSTNLEEIRLAVSGGGVEWPWLLLIGAGMMLVGLCFKIAAAPFHVWTPDVYEGAPSVVTGWMSTGPKAAAFAAFIRLYTVIFVVGAPILSLNLASETVLSVIAILTMVLGNVVAMAQDNIKRMLAYSSIAHAGYAMVGLIAGDWQSVAFYLLGYSVMNIGAFAIIAIVAKRYDRATNVEDYRGLGFEAKGLGVALSIFLVSLAGFPMTAGFMGKLFVFKAGWIAGLYTLVVFGVLNSAASVYYYLRPIVAMYFSPAPEGERPQVALRGATLAAVVVSIIAIFYLGLAPDLVWRFITLSAN